MTRMKILRAYQRGQEREDGPAPTDAYLDAVRLAVQEVAIAEGRTVPGHWL